MIVSAAHPGAIVAREQKVAADAEEVVRHVGDSLVKAMEIALLNPTITAAEAAELGIVNRVVPDDAVLAEAGALARQLAGGATRALAAAKRLLWDGIGATMEARLPDESRTVSELSGTADAREGLAAVIEKRQPKFSGR